MGKGGRLTKERDYQTVFKQGKTWANSLLVLKVLPNGLGTNRYGFSVGKRLGKAVVRNRVKRLLREGVRLTPIEPGWDMLFIARGAAVTADFHTLKGAIEDLLSRAQLLRDGGGAC